VTINVEQLTRNCLAAYQAKDIATIAYINRIFLNDLSAAAELEITVNQTELLNVVDVLSFNEEGKILSIVAYKSL